MMKNVFSFFGAHVFIIGAIAFLAFAFLGCASIERVGIGLFYKKSRLLDGQIVKNISYINDGQPKHQFDLFLPKGTNWPILVFVHGGGWNSGDKNFRVGGADVYGNIGRFFATHGIGVAVINYRLQPQFNWREQVQDVAKATAWVHSNIARYGGNPQKLFLAGHSAGTQLICHVALDEKNLAAENLSLKIISGVIAVSGAGLDLADEKTYELGQKKPYYEQRFRLQNSGENWQREASPTTYVQSDSPPFLILRGSSEKKSLQRQSQLLHETLSAKGVENKIISVPHQSHGRMVLTLSRPDKISAPAMLDFIKKN